jgi:hypothetical protein
MKINYIFKPKKKRRNKSRRKKEGNIPQSAPEPVPEVRKAAIHKEDKSHRLLFTYLNFIDNRQKARRKFLKKIKKNANEKFIQICILGKSHYSTVYKVKN